MLLQNEGTGMDNEKKRMGCGIAAVIAMLLGGLFLIGFGIFMLTVVGEPPIAYICGGVGLFVLIGSIASIVVMIRNSRQGVTLESKQQWQSGILTDKVIKKDLYAHSKTLVIGWFATSGVLAFFAVIVVCFSETFTEKTLLLAAAPFVTLFLGIKAVIDRNREAKYRIETDKVLGGETKVTLDVIDAVTTHIPTQTSYLYLEKHGEYKINAMHIHAHIPPKTLAEMIEPGEEIFVIYAEKTNKLLHIYRKKYWTI